MNVSVSVLVRARVFSRLRLCLGSVATSLTDLRCDGGGGGWDAAGAGFARGRRSVEEASRRRRRFSLFFYCARVPFYSGAALSRLNRDARAAILAVSPVGRPTPRVAPQCACRGGASRRPALVCVCVCVCASARWFVCASISHWKTLISGWKVRVIKVHQRLGRSRRPTLKRAKRRRRRRRRRARRPDARWPSWPPSPPPPPSRFRVRAVPPYLSGCLSTPLSVRFFRVLACATSGAPRPRWWQPAADRWRPRPPAAATTEAHLRFCFDGHRVLFRRSLSVADEGNACGRHRTSPTRRRVTCTGNVCRVPIGWRRPHCVLPSFTGFYGGGAHWRFLPPPPPPVHPTGAVWSSRPLLASNNGPLLPSFPSFSLVWRHEFRATRRCLIKTEPPSRLPCWVVILRLPT